MGLDLALLIPDNPYFSPPYEYSLCLNRLRFAPNYQIFGQLRDLVEGGFLNPGELDVKPTIPTHPLPPNWKVCLSENDEAERISLDHNDEPLRYAYARDLKRLEFPADTKPMNKAIKAFLNELNDDFVLILYWY